MSSNIDKFTDTFCDQLKNPTSILKRNVNVNIPQEVVLRPLQEQSLVVKTRNEETRKRHHHEVFFSEDSDDSDNIDTPTHKSTRVNSHHSCVQLSTAPPYKNDDKVSITDEEEMNRNLKAFQRESAENKSDKDGIDDGKDHFMELAQE